jgi:hypothetical protein
MEVITGDESWFFECYPEIKRESEEYHTSQFLRHKKAHEQTKNHNSSHNAFQFPQGSS